MRPSPPSVASSAPLPPSSSPSEWTKRETGETQVWHRLWSADRPVDQHLRSGRWSALGEDLQRRLQKSRLLLQVWEGHCRRADALTCRLQTLRADATVSGALDEGDEEQIAIRIRQVEVRSRRQEALEVIDHPSGFRLDQLFPTFPRSSNRTSCRRPTFCCLTCRRRWRPPGL